MKKFLLTLFILLSVGVFAKPVQASGVLGDFNLGMVGYWPLNEGSGTVLRDQSGGNNTATLTSPSWSTSGKFGKALSFAGSPQIASTSLAFPSSGSISVWVFPTSYADWVSPAGWKVLATSHNGYALIDEGGSGTPGRWRAVFQPTGDATELDIVALQNITQNTWQHVVMTWSKSGTTYTVKLYLNNVLQGSGTWVGATTPNIGHFHFGNSGDYPDNYFLGKVDDVRVYNYAMTPAQISIIYKVGTPATTIGHSNNVTLSTGLVGYWPFDGNTTNWATGRTSDLSSNGVNGSLVGLSTTTSSVAGKIGGALKFSSATAQEVSLGTTPANLTFAYSQPFSISLWAKPSATVGSGVFNRMVSTSATSNKFEYFVMANNNAFSFNVGKNGIGDASVAGSTFTLGQWYHLVGVYNGTNINFYINGVSVGTAAYTFGALSNPDGILSIGGGGAAGNTFDGSIDDVRIYNRALSASEVAQLYTNGGGVIAHSNTVANSNGLLGYWTFDGPKINWVTGAITDSSGQGNTGSLVSMSTSTSPVAGKVGQGLKFNGSTSYVSTPLTYNWNANNWSIGLWASSISCPNSFCGLVGDRFGTGASNWFTFGSSGNFTGNIVVEIGPAPGAVTIDSGYNPVGKGWQYYTVTKSGTTITIYKNGVSLASGSTSGKNIGDTTNSVRIGNWFSSNQIWNGSIDDVRIYNRALSAGEVAQLFSSTK